MKYLLAAINAKYIHSNLGIYSLKKYAEEKLSDPPQIELGEYTINHQMDRILQDIYKRCPDVVGFSCYIWNILYVKELVRNLKKVMPKLRIWLGGPEVSYDAVGVLKELPEVELVMLGEGEETFRRLVELTEKTEKAQPKGVKPEKAQPEEAKPKGAKPGGVKPEEENTEKSEQQKSALWRDGLQALPGVAFREAEERVVENGPAPLLSLDEIPFSYGDLSGLEHRIIYYESSRGCPFSCSYCLSSIDKRVRFRSLELVKKELDFFLEKRVPQVKFVDRTFNCKKSHAVEIWRYLLEHDNGVTNFHFEISADLLDEEEMALIRQMRPGLIQLEIGVQTTHPETITEIRRSMDLKKLARNVACVNSFRNVHQHLDLIAGLPYENLERFWQSFDEVYRMEPEQLQLGFLKVLKGSYMEEKAADYELIYQSQPPYEVLSTRWMKYGDVIRLKGVEEMVEVYYNSGQFRTTLQAMETEGLFSSPFVIYDTLAQYYEEKGINGISHNRLARYEILFDFLKERMGVRGQQLERFRDRLMYDLYLRENVKSRPSFAGELSPFKEAAKEFFRKEAAAPKYLEGYDGYDSRQLSKMAHLEAMGDGSYVLFDYKNRDVLLGNARAFHLTAEQVEERD